VSLGSSPTPAAEVNIEVAEAPFIHTRRSTEQPPETATSSHASDPRPSLSIPVSAGHHHAGTIGPRDAGASRVIKVVFVPIVHFRIRF